MSLAETEKLGSFNVHNSGVIPVPLAKTAAAPTALGYIAGSIQKLIFKDLMALARGLEGDLESDVGRAESLLAWAEKFENPEQSK